MSSIVPTDVAPSTPKHPRDIQVLRAVASLELIKGMIVLLAAGGILLLLHREDSWDLANGLLSLLHISPDHHFAQVFLDWADSLTQTKVWAVAGTSVGYSLLRFVEGYGLWYAKAWAAWMALISGLLYLPFEIYSLAHKQSLLHVAVLSINVAVVLYMAYALKTGAGLHRVRQLT